MACDSLLLIGHPGKFCGSFSGIYFSILALPLLSRCPWSPADCLASSPSQYLDILFFGNVTLGVPISSSALEGTIPPRAFGSQGVPLPVANASCFHLSSSGFLHYVLISTTPSSLITTVSPQTFLTPTDIPSFHLESSASSPTNYGLRCHTLFPNSSKGLRNLFPFLLSNGFFPSAPTLHNDIKSVVRCTSQGMMG